MADWHQDRNIIGEGYGGAKLFNSWWTGRKAQGTNIRETIYSTQGYTSTSQQNVLYECPRHLPRQSSWHQSSMVTSSLNVFIWCVMRSSRTPGCCQISDTRMVEDRVLIFHTKKIPNPNLLPGDSWKPLPQDVLFPWFVAWDPIPESVKIWNQR